MTTTKGRRDFLTSSARTLATVAFASPLIACASDPETDAEIPRQSDNPTSPTVPGAPAAGPCTLLPADLYDPKSGKQIFDKATSASFFEPPKSSNQAGFTRMDAGGPLDWLTIGFATDAQQASVPKIVLNMLRRLEKLYVGYRIDHLSHSLQVATRAKRANQPDEIVLVALLHDVGNVISIEGHAEIAAAIVRSYVADNAYQVLRVHDDLFGKYSNRAWGRDADLRSHHKSQPWYSLAERFAEEWDAPSLDPTYPTMKLEDFAPLVEKTFAKATWKPPHVCG